MKEMLMQELEEVKAELQHAEECFQYADERYFEIANQQLTIARAKYDLIFKKLRLLSEEELEEPKKKKKWFQRSNS